MDRFIDRLAKGLFYHSGGAGEVDRRRLLHRGSRGLAALVAGAAAARVPAAETAAKSRRKRKKQRIQLGDGVVHVGPGPTRPLYIPPESRALSAEEDALAELGYEPCTPDWKCSKNCDIDKNSWCAGRIQRKNGWECYMWKTKTRRCQRVVCWNGSYCAKITSWGKRCTGPAGCLG